MTHHLSQRLRELTQELRRTPKPLAEIIPLLNQAADELDRRAPAPTSEPGVRDDDAVREFSMWLSREMPPGTVISDPTWWARKIAARFATPASPAVPATKPLHQVVAEWDAMPYAKNGPVPSPAPVAPSEPWFPIETAPKDGAVILLANSEGVWAGYYHPVYQSGFRPNTPWASMMMNHDYFAKPRTTSSPTHWMPLPPAATKAPTKAYRDGWDRVFAPELCLRCGRIGHTPEDCKMPIPKDVKL
jgi:hypothetical protein